MQEFKCKTSSEKKPTGLTGGGGGEGTGSTTVEPTKVKRMLGKFSKCWTNVEWSDQMASTASPEQRKCCVDVECVFKPIEI